ncbi:hypothetical protein K8I61_15945 [bacterium]|nr:hypothetical protein [bacterium]
MKGAENSSFNKFPRCRRLCIFLIVAAAVILIFVIASIKLLMDADLAEIYEDRIDRYFSAFETDSLSSSIREFCRRLPSTLPCEMIGQSYYMRQQDCAALPFLAAVMELHESNHTASMSELSIFMLNDAKERCGVNDIDAIPREAKRLMAFVRKEPHESGTLTP